MNRLILVSAVAAAAAAVSVPAFAGLSNNPSFNHRVPVHVPSQAKVVHLDDHGKVVDSRQSGPASTTVASPARSRSAEPGDDRGQTSEPGDDRGGATSAPGNGGGATTEPGDDRGVTSEPGDDSGGHGGSGGSGGSGSGGHGG
jgi:hypothetical protein